MGKLSERQFYDLVSKTRVTVPASKISVVRIPNRNRTEGYVPALHTNYKGTALYKFIAISKEDQLANKYN